MSSEGATGPLTSMDKRSLSERDICTKFITPPCAGQGGTRCCKSARK